MKLGFGNDRRFFAALLIMSLGCFVFEAIMRVYGVPHMPLRFGLKSFATFIGIGVFSVVLVRYKADRNAFFFIGLSLFCFVLTRAFDVEAIHRFGQEILGLNRTNFSRVVDNSVQKAGIYCVMMSLVSLIITSAQRRSEAITESKQRAQREAELRASESAFRQLFQCSPHAASRVSLEGYFVLVNRRLCEVMGYGTEDLTGMSMEVLVLPEDRERYIEALQRLRDGESERECCQLRVRHKNGFAIWVENELMIAGGAEPGGSYFLVVCDDITEQKRRGEELEASASLLEAVMNSTDDGILVVDANGRIMRCNARFLDMWQLTVSDTKGISDQEFSSLVVEQLADPMVLLSGVRAQQQAAEEGCFERLKMKDGRCFEWTTHVHSVDEGRLVRIWRFRDVTSGESGESGVSDPVSSEATARETQIREELRAVAERVNHDLNNHLSTILSNTEVVATLVDEKGEVHECLDDISVACNQSKDLIDRLRRFMRQPAPRRERLDIVPLIHDVEKFLRPAVPEEILIRLRLESDVPAVLGDPTQFQQVLLNICANAIDGLQGKPGLIDVELTTEYWKELKRIGEDSLPSGPYVKIRIADNGCGIAEGMLARVYDPFFTTKSTGKSSGLGLTTVRGIVRDHGGGIRLHSKEGEGTTVELYFPGTVADVSTTKGVEPLVGAGQHVLLLDDEASVARSLVKRMRQLNYQPVMFTNGTEALEALESDPLGFDLVMTDLRMPMMDGIEFARQLRRRDLNLPVILLTGAEDGTIHQQAAKVGVSVILRKPFDSGAMSWAVQEALSRGSDVTTAAKIVG